MLILDLNSPTDGNIMGKSNMQRGQLNSPTDNMPAMAANSNARNNAQSTLGPVPMVAKPCCQGGVNNLQEKRQVYNARNIQMQSFMNKYQK